MVKRGRVATGSLCRVWAGALALASLLICAGCRKVESYEKPLTPVKTQAVESQSLSSETARYSANIQPDTQVDLAFKVGGYVEGLLQVNGRPVQEGDWVSKGATLARVRDDDFAARLKQAKAQLAETLAAEAQVNAQLAEAQVALEGSRRDLGRADRLLEKESLTKPDRDAAGAKVEMGQARIDSIKAQQAMTRARADAAKAQIEEIEAARKDTELKAPMDGMVLKRNVEIGSLAAPGAAAFSLAEIKTVKAVFGVPDVETPHLKPGDSLTITTEAVHGVEFRGKLTRISPSADPKTRIFDVEVKVLNPSNRLKVGMVVALEAAGKGPAAPVTVAPLPSLIQLKEKDGAFAVFVVEGRNGGQVARLRRVRVGQTLGNMVAITEGVKAGEQVIVSGATLVADGEPVRVVP
jgi:multidrug efflux system membrane fusion protein